MISSIICIIKSAGIAWGEFTHIVLPIIIAEFILEVILINILPDILDKKREKTK